MNATAFVHAADIRVTSPKARDEQKAAIAAAVAAAEARGARAERTRVLAIINSSEAKYRFRTALHIALKTEISVEEARELLVFVGEGAA